MKMSTLIYKGEIPFEKFIPLLSVVILNDIDIEKLMEKLVVKEATKKLTYELAKRAHVHVVEDIENFCYKVTVYLP